jgi:hypothetical protein
VVAFAVFQLLDCLNLCLDAHFHGLVLDASSSSSSSTLSSTTLMLLENLQRTCAQQMTLSERASGLLGLLRQLVSGADGNNLLPKQPLPDYSIEVFEL